MNYRFSPKKLLAFITLQMPLCSEQKLNGEVIKANSQTHGNNFYPVKQKSSLEWSSSLHLYIFISSWFNPVTPTDKFNFRLGQNFRWCQIGSRREPLSWLLHLLYIFIIGLFSSCRVPTHRNKEKIHTHLNTLH